MSVLNFSLETVIDGSAMGVDRKLREACLSEIFPDKISTGRSATKSRGEASNVRQLESSARLGLS